MFTFNVVAVASQALVLDEKAFAVSIGERLSAGIVPADAMRQISKDVDKFVVGVLTAAQAPQDLQVEAMGALHPQPPKWTDQFIELVQRVAAEPEAARELPRRMDLLAFERLTRRRHVDDIAVKRVGLDDPATGRLIRLVAAFLRSQAALVDIVDRALTSPVDPQPAPAAEGANSERSTVQPSLLDGQE